MLIHINQITIYVQIEARAFEFQNATFNVFGFFLLFDPKATRFAPIVTSLRSRLNGITGIFTVIQFNLFEAFEHQSPMHFATKWMVQMD